MSEDKKYCRGTCQQPCLICSLASRVTIVTCHKCYVLQWLRVTIVTCYNCYVLRLLRVKNVKSYKCNKKKLYFGRFQSNRDARIELFFCVHVIFLKISKQNI